MGGQERFCKGGGVSEMARGWIQWVGRNQGCDGGHGDGVDDGGRRRRSESDRGAGKWGGAVLRGYTDVVNKGGGLQGKGEG
eukprot:scaffold3875_cov102-Amphora_coffeaeformis.AAC.3